MADEIIGVTIPELPEGGTLTGAEQFEMVQDGVSRRTTADEIKTLVGAVTDIQSSTLDVSIADGVATVNVINDLYTPTISNITFDATVSISDCFYVELGKWANMSFVLDVQMDAAASYTTFDVSLPFTTSGVSILTFGNQSLVVDNILSTATGASVGLNVQSLNAGDNIEKLEVSINFFLA